MNKKNILLILVGIAIQIIEFRVKIGGIYIDLSSDIIAYVLIFIGILPLTLRNNLFKKSRNNAAIALLVAIFAQAVSFFDLADAQRVFDLFTRALTTIFSIYFTYYFTEGLILEAKSQDKSAVTRGFRLIWTFLGASVFAYYVAYMSQIELAIIIVQVISLLAAIYYIYSVYSACSHLYTDDMPTNIQN